MVSFLGDLPGGGWPSGTYYTDGAGGVDGRWPVLRRCGCAVALLRADASMIFAAFFPLAVSP